MEYKMNKKYCTTTERPKIKSIRLGKLKSIDISKVLQINDK